LISNSATGDEGQAAFFHKHPPLLAWKENWIEPEN
jgi:hypothetical protein